MRSVYAKANLVQRLNLKIVFTGFQRPDFVSELAWEIIDNDKYSIWTRLVAVFHCRKDISGSGHLGTSKFNYLTQYDATDPKDYVYGFLGLIRSGLRADYSKFV
jgi:hypothetical protein